jgi:hypothetical protein
MDFHDRRLGYKRDVRNVEMVAIDIVVAEIHRFRSREVISEMAVSIWNKDSKHVCST